MKATDLMIGDWVMRGNTASEPMKVTEIIPYKDYVCMDFTGLAVAAKFSQINPIPLTPEILERNGFVSDFLGDMFWESESTRFALQKGLDGRNRWWWEVCNSPFLPLNYVHELQHALKLCGIEKEITL